MVIVGASTEYLFGQFIPVLGALMVLTILDIITGLAKGFYDRSLISKKMSQGMIIKAMMFVVIMVANMLDIAYSEGLPIFRTGVISFYIYMEVISIFENLEQMKVPIPEFIRQRLKIVQRETEGAESFGDFTNKGS